MHVSEKVGVDLTNADAVHQPGSDDDDDDVLVEDGRKGSQWHPKYNDTKCMFAPAEESVARKRKSEAMSWDDVLPPEKPGIGESCISEQALHMAARELAEACESWSTAPLSATSARQIDADVLPKIIAGAQHANPDGDTGQEFADTATEDESDADVKAENLSAILCANVAGMASGGGEDTLAGMASGSRSGSDAGRGSNGGTGLASSSHSDAKLASGSNGGTGLASGNNWKKSGFPPPQP
eukprot:1727747-Lingulodinium_polyedra.AAC.1